MDEGVGVVQYRLHDLRHRTTVDVQPDQIYDALMVWYPDAFEEGRDMFRALQRKTLRGEDSKREQADLMVTLVPLT